MKMYWYHHDRQLILQCLCGVKDELVTQGTKALEDKAAAKKLKSCTLTFRVDKDGEPVEDAANAQQVEPFYKTLSKFSIA
jgi:hypothetical protein